MQKEIANFHRELFRHNQRRINNSVMDYTPELKKYEASYHRQSNTYSRRTSWLYVLAAAANADLVYVGDYHTLPQAQKSFATLLRQLCQHKDKIVIALEFVLSSHQKDLDLFQAGKISEKTFLRRIEYEDCWMLGGWEEYKSILEIARDYGIPVYGLNAKRIPNAPNGIALRDKHFSKVLLSIAKSHPNATILTQVGELHVAPDHLPLCTKNLFKKHALSPKQISIFQNSEQIYHKLMEKGLTDETEVVQVAPHVYCLINTPPIICQRSFINWLEAEDDPLSGTEAGSLFRRCAKAIARFLDIDLKNSLDQVEVVSYADFSFWNRLKRSHLFSQQELKILKEQIIHSESYTIPKANLVYLAKLSLNHAAEEAAHFIRYTISGIDEPIGLVDSFYHRCLEEGLAFFASKLINPKRKAGHTSKFQAITRRANRGETIDPFTLKTAHQVLAHKRLENGIKIKTIDDIFYAPPELFNAVTHSLGYMLGDRLFYAVMQDDVSAKEVSLLFQEKFQEETVATNMYFYWAQKLKNIKIPKRVS